MMVARAIAGTSLDDDNNHNSSLNASYRSPYGTFSAGYSYG
ncbi:hypothetical protein ACNKHV_19865 [Shigella flexneri]